MCWNNEKHLMTLSFEHLHLNKTFYKSIRMQHINEIVY